MYRYHPEIMATLKPPQVAVYDSSTIAEARVQQWAEAHGYATVRKNSACDKQGEVRKIWIICDKGGKVSSTKLLFPDTAKFKECHNKLSKKAVVKRGQRSVEIRISKTGCEFMLTVTRNGENK